MRAKAARRVSGAALVALCLAAQAGDAQARERDGSALRRPQVGGTGSLDASESALSVDPMRARAQQALERGLDWLAAQQALQRDGSFPNGHSEHYVPVAVTALGALAYMAGGSTPERGPHGRELASAIDYLLDRADRSPGSERLGYISSDGDNHSRMHGQGFATLALAQAYSMSPRTTRGARTEQVLRLAVDLIERCQGPDGGWFYDPKASFEHENSVTVTMIQALRGARNAGLDVSSEVITKAVSYIERCQNENGSFRYSLGQETSSVALTAAGIATLNSIGRYEGPELDRATEWLWKELIAREDAGGVSPALHPFYERLYLAQALWQNPDQRLFERWSLAERERVLGKQRQDGSWGDPQYGDCYATAMNCLYLAIPEGLLPIFQR
jgi:hypothetical protein